LRKITSYDALNAKIGPTGLSVGALMNFEKWSKHWKVLGDFAHVGGTNPGRIDP